MMQTVVRELLDLLRLERLEDNLFRGQSRDIGTRYVFGGQVLGQALSAAQQTVEAVRGVHSLPNAEHSWGLISPCSTSPERHSGDSSVWMSVTSKRSSAS